MHHFRSVYFALFCFLSSQFPNFIAWDEGPDGVDAIPGPVISWWYREAVKWDNKEDPPRTILFIDDNERMAGHAISWMQDLNDGLVAYTGDKNLKAASMSCCAASQEPVPGNMRTEMQMAMRAGIPKGIPLYVHYNLESARAQLEMSEKALTVKEQQRKRRELAEQQRIEAKAKKEQEKYEKSQQAASQPGTQPSGPARKRAPKPAVPKPKPAPVDFRSREEILRDRRAAGLTAGKSMKRLRAVTQETIHESQSEAEESEASELTSGEEVSYSPPPPRNDPDAPPSSGTKDLPPPRKPHPSRVTPVSKPARKRPISAVEEEEGEGSDPGQASQSQASQSAARSTAPSAAQELLERVSKKG